MDPKHWRKIIHVDMDAFFASVEQRDHPHLRGKPIAVGGGGKRGVVAAASYEARVFGVRSAMPGAVAQRLCPGLIFVRHRFEVYHAVSQQIRAIFAEYTDLIEPLSLDEAYLDITENKLDISSARQVAEEIRAKIFNTTQLTASAGVSFNKFLAKIASDLNKPDGLAVITPAKAIAFLEALPIQKFHGIGKVTAAKMERMGIRTGADLKKYSELELAQQFGKAGRHYFRIVRGEDYRRVNPNRIRKSIGAERTYRDNITSLAGMEAKVNELAEVVFTYQRKKENYGRTVTLKAKTPEFQIFTRSKTLQQPVKQLDDLRSIALALLREHIHEFPKVRLLGVTVSNLEHDQVGGSIQLELDFQGRVLETVGSSEQE